MATLDETQCDETQNPLCWFLHALSQMASKSMKMEFLELGVNIKVVGNVENYLNMKFQPNIFTRSRENAEKPHFWA